MSDSKNLLACLRVCGDSGENIKLDGDLLHQAADRIEELEQQLAARDGEIADWLRAKAGAQGAHPLCQGAFSYAATAIASGAYRSNADE